MASDRINMADPDFEPTDEQLQELAHQAFAGIREKQAELRRTQLAEISLGSRHRIAALRSEARLTPPTKR